MNIEPAVPAATGGGPPTASLRGRAIRGSLVSVAQAVAANVIRLGSNLVLTRLLFPEAFGIMALIHTLMSGLHMVSDIGLHPIVINHGSAEQRWFRDTIWTIALVRGAMLTLLGLIAAWPMAVFYQEPDLVFYLPVVSLSAFVLGTTSVNWILAQRRLDFLRIASIEVGIQVVAAAATIGLAWWTRNEWALVVGSLFGPCFQSLMSHLAVPGDRDRIAWNPEVVDNVRRFGKWLFVSSIATFLAGRLDVLLLGRLLIGQKQYLVFEEQRPERRRIRRGRVGDARAAHLCAEGAGEALHRPGLGYRFRHDPLSHNRPASMLAQRGTGQQHQPGRDEHPHRRDAVGCHGRRALEDSAVVIRDGRILAVRRPETGLMAGLWELPGGEIGADDEAKDRVGDVLREAVGLEVAGLQSAGRVEHLFTHRRLDLEVFVGRARRGDRVRRDGYTAHRWVAPSRLLDLAHAGPTRKAMVLLGAADEVSARDAGRRGR